MICVEVNPEDPTIGCQARYRQRFSKTVGRHECRQSLFNLRVKKCFVKEIPFAARDPPAHYQPLDGLGFADAGAGAGAGTMICFATQQ